MISKNKHGDDVNIIINKNDLIDLINEIPNFQDFHLSNKLMKLIRPGYSIDLDSDGCVISLNLDGFPCAWDSGDVEIIRHMINSGSLDNYEDLIGIPIAPNSNNGGIKQRPHAHNQLVNSTDSESIIPWDTVSLSYINLFLRRKNLKLSM